MSYACAPDDTAQMDACIEKVQAQGHDQSSAIAICCASIGKARTMKSNQIAKQAAAKRRQLKDLEHKAELTRQAYEAARAEAVTEAESGGNPNWLDPEGKGLSDNPPPVRPAGAFLRLAPGTSDTLAQQTPYTPRDWIQPERRIDEKQPPTGYGNPMSMDMEDEPLPPFGGATSLADVQAYFDAQGKAAQMDQLVDIYQAVLGNIMSADDIADKGGAIATAAGELQKLMAGMKALAETDEKAQWDTAFINDLPDSAFLFIESGGKKDEEGKTAPRSMRHFPYKDSGGKVDLPHLRNALGRIPQSNAPGLNKDTVTKRAQDLLAAANEKPKELEGTEEKDTQSLFQKFMSWVKAGARHSSADQGHLQDAHDSIVKAGADCGMKVLKAADGSYRWVGWVSNKWRDRDTAKHPSGEIISEAAHKEFVAWLDTHPDQAPQWWTWHTPVRKARADWWDYADGFLMMSGAVPAGEEKGYLEMDEPVAMSHGFITLERDSANGIINQYRSFEVSDLPLEKAANPWTAFDLVRKELSEMPFSPDKRAYFVKVFGEERTKQLETETESMGKALDQAGVEAKERTAEGAAAQAAAGTTATELPAHILDQVKQLLNVDGLNAALVELGKTNKALADQVAAQAAAMAELKKSDDAKIAETIAPKVKPLVWGYQASAAKDNELTEEQKAALKVGQSESWVKEAFADLVH